jgi:hypothetical protein
MVEMSYDDIKIVNVEEPDWTALEKMLPPEYSPDGFMWMGTLELPDGTLINEYKHGITRKSFAIGQNARVYLYFCGAYRETTLRNALYLVFQDIYRLGADPQTPYNQAYIDRRDSCLRNANCGEDRRQP